MCLAYEKKTFIVNEQMTQMNICYMAMQRETILSESVQGGLKVRELGYFFVGNYVDISKTYVGGPEQYFE